MKRICLKITFALGAFAAGLGTAAAEEDASLVRAKALLESFSGGKVVGNDPALAAVRNLIQQGDLREAANSAMGQTGFLNVTVKQMALRMSTREETIRAPFNDFTATFIGIARDDLDARLLLTGDFYYRGDVTRLPNDVTIRADVKNDIILSNNHYEDIDQPKLDLAFLLVKVAGQPLWSTTQNKIVTNPDPAGVLTSRAFLDSHASAGTNRRMVEFAFREFMCMPIDKWADTAASDGRIGRDIDRFPGGDHIRFQTTCKGCHTQMDGFRGATANLHFPDNKLVYSKAESANFAGFNNWVATKLNHNETIFKYGYVTTDNSWVNNARNPANMSMFGWRGDNIERGTGMREFGTLMANSRRFSECMVRRTFEALCRKPFSIESSKTTATALAQKFENNKYSLKKLFVDVALTQECGL